MKRRAFTLIELLTVLAVSAILLTIIVVPLFQGFNLTRAAQSFAEAQDRARNLIEKISREVSTAAAVRDNSGDAGVLLAPVPSGPGTAAATVNARLPFAKLDIWLPAQEGPVATDAGGNFLGYIDPRTGKIDPTLQAPKGQTSLPASPGLVMVRYFIALRDPFQPYNNPYQVWNNNAANGAVLQAGRNSGRDNLFVLYRAEVAPFEVRNGQLRPNLDYFQADASDTQITDFDDPAFFVRDGSAAKDARIRNWLRRAVVQTDISRYDMIMPVYDKNSRRVTFDNDGSGNFIPRLLPLIQFRPGRVSEGATEGQVAVRLGEETDNPQAVAPDVFRTQFGGWSNAIVRTFPLQLTGIAPNQTWVPWTGGNPYLLGRRDPTTNDFNIFVVDPGSGQTESAPGPSIFNVSAFEREVSTGSRPYPFSRAITASASANRDLFVPYVPDPNLGRIVASFGIDQFGNTATATFRADRNLPGELSGPAVSVSSDTGLDIGTFSDPQYASINRRFNKLWADAQNNRNGLTDGILPNIHRFVDLRVTPQADGTASPLDPRTGFVRASIVPGSEEVYGPDQTAGANFAKMVRYTRITRGTPGPNQYRLNYVDVPEPDYSVAFGLPPGSTPPANYTPTDLLSAVFQPRFKAGYLQLSSDPNVPLPDTMLVPDNATPPNYTAVAGSIRVYYKVQFTRATRPAGAPRGGVGVSDTFAVDYDSRQMISLHLTIRNFPQSSVPNPQSVTLTANAPVRNYLR